MKAVMGMMARIMRPGPCCLPTRAIFAGRSRIETKFGSRPGPPPTLRFGGPLGKRMRVRRHCGRVVGDDGQRRAGVVRRNDDVGCE